MRPRLIIDTTEEIRLAAQWRAYRLSAERGTRVSVSDFLNELLSDTLSHELGEIARRQKADDSGNTPPPQRRKRPARPEGP